MRDGTGQRLPFAEVLRDGSRGVRKVPGGEFQSTGAYPIVDQGSSDIAGYSDDGQGLCKNVPAIVFGDHTRCVKFVDRPFLAGADGVKVLVPKRTGDNPKYLYYALRSADIPSLGYSRHFKLVKELSFLMPNRKKQDAIVDQLDRVMSQRVLLERRAKLLDELVKSRFVEMFGDPACTEGTDEKIALGERCTIVTGNTPSRRHPEYYGDSLEWVKTDNINNTGVINTATERLSELGATKARVAPTGSILMCCIAGSVKSIGRVGLLDRPAAFNQQINAVIPHDDCPEYVLWLLKLSKDYLCSDINMQLKGILNKSTLASKKFRFAPLSLQQDFAAFVARVDALKAANAQAITHLQTLYDSLAQDYFGG